MSEVECTDTGDRREEEVKETTGSTTQYILRMGIGVDGRRGRGFDSYFLSWDLTVVG